MWAAVHLVVLVAASVTVRALPHIESRRLSELISSSQDGVGEGSEGRQEAAVYKALVQARPRRTVKVISEPMRWGSRSKQEGRHQQRFPSLRGYEESIADIVEKFSSSFRERQGRGKRAVSSKEREHVSSKPKHKKELSVESLRGAVANDKEASKLLDQLLEMIGTSTEVREEDSGVLGKVFGMTGDLQGDTLEEASRIKKDKVMPAIGNEPTKLNPHSRAHHDGSDSFISERNREVKSYTGKKAAQNTNEEKTKNSEENDEVELRLYNRKYDEEAARVADKRDFEGGEDEEEEEAEDDVDDSDDEEKEREKRGEEEGEEEEQEGQEENQEDEDEETGEEADEKESAEEGEEESDEEDEEQAEEEEQRK